MAETSFYLLKTDTSQERYLFACKLVEKIYRLGQTCYVLTETDKQSEWLDNLLWTFRQGSFIPHQIYNGEPTISAMQRVLIGTLPAPEHWQNTIVNLSSQCPQAERVVEIVDEVPETKAAGRVRYRQYKQLGVTLSTHNM